MPTTIFLIVECTFLPTPWYYVEMPCNLAILANNNEQDEIMLNLEDPSNELKDLIVPS
jgi:hypothetical protein